MQVEINEKMRGILVDWLVEVHLKFKVRRRRWPPTASTQDTLSLVLVHLAVSNMPRSCAPLTLSCVSAAPAVFLQLMPETLYLTCNIIDRYLAIRNVTRKRLQLVSLAD